MLARKLKEILANKLLTGCVIALLLAQVLYIFGLGWFFVPALVFLFAIGLPFPVVFSSLVARLIAGFMLAFSFIQVSAVVQFFLLPDSDFRALSSITTLLAVVSVLVFYREAKQPKTVADGRDAGALLTAAFFAVPFALFCFWGNDALRLAAFGGQQSPDGSAHNVAFDEMYGSQHLTYRTNPNFYPKGYHIANSLVMDSFKLHKKQNSWLTNARIFAAQYVVWGSLLAATLYYLARQLAGHLISKMGRASDLLLGGIVGPVLSLFYLLPFANQGFINFYYICAAFVCGLIFLEGFKLSTKSDSWLVLGYFLFAFGTVMSWGPLLLPAVLLVPVLYLFSDSSDLKDALRQLFSRRYLAVWIGLALMLAPVYLYFAYASENSFNAYGSIRVFNYALLIAGMVMTLYLVFGKLSMYVKDFVTNALLPAWLLVGGLVLAQYFLVGETRYYSIKTAYLLELVLIAVASALLLAATLKSGLTIIKQWLLVPVAFGIGIFLLISANGNPVEHVRNMVGKVSYFENDFRKVTDLGIEGELKVSNNTVLHYIPAESKIIGNPLLPNWANGLSPVSDGNSTSAACNGKIFSILAYGSGSAEEQQVLVQAIKDCIEDRVVKQDKPYYIVTDPASLPYLKAVLGDKPTFL